PAVELAVDRDRARVVLAAGDTARSGLQKTQIPTYRNRGVPVRQGTVPELPLRVLSPAVRLPPSHDAARMVEPRGEQLEAETPHYGYGLGSGLRAAISQLAPPVGPPAIRLTLEREAARVTRAGHHRRKTVPARHRHRDGRILERTVPQLTEVVLPPAVHEPRRRQPTRVVRSARQPTNANAPHHAHRDAAVDVRPVPKLSPVHVVPPAIGFTLTVQHATVMITRGHVGKAGRQLHRVRFSDQRAIRRVAPR